MKRPAWLDDPATPGLLLFAGIALAGFVVMGIGFDVATGYYHRVFAQTPIILSGGFGGLALVLMGSGLASIQTSRGLAAQERRETELVLDEIAALTATIREQA